MKKLLLRLTLLAVLALCTLSGCRNSGSKDSGLGLGLLGDRSDSAELASRGDPLFGDRIPKQNLPTKGVARVIGDKEADPLFALPAGDKPPIERAGSTDSGGSASRNGAYPEPYRPSRDTTNAALASVIAPDDSTLSIGPRRTPAASTSRNLQSYDLMLAELRRSGARVGEPTREDGNYVIRAEVPIDPKIPGPARWYEGFGSTPAVALRQIVEQVRADKLR